MTDGKQRIGVVGAGAMGRGIAQLFAAAGHDVAIFDAQPGAAGAARDFIASMFSRAADKGKMAREDAGVAINRVVACEQLSDLAPCRVVIEAIVEQIGPKQQLFQDLEAILAEDAILATNTSSLIVSEITARCVRPERVAGLHFFNPVPLMKVAEVIAAVRTDPEILAELRAIVEDAGHRAVSALDQPGFLVNHAGRGLYTEGLAILEEQVASHETIDRVLREAAGFRMGPFELFDLTGLDVSGRVLESIFAQFQHDPRYRPSSLLPPRIAAGLFGRKTGAGWYRYTDMAAPSEAAPRPVMDVSDLPPFWVDPKASRHDALAALVETAGARLTTDATDADAVLLVQPWGRDTAGVCAVRGLDPARCIAIDPLPPLDRHRTLMSSVLATAQTRSAALALFGSDGTPATLIADSPGFIVQRVLAMIVNIATGIAQRGIATVDDLEDAVRLGLGYPKGPLAWGDEIGPARILEILRNTSAATGDPRYRPTLWLRRRAELGLSLRENGPDKP